MDNEERLASGEAWREFCERLKASGDRLLGPDFPGGARERAEGYRHLSRLLMQGLLEQVEMSDRDFPVMYRHNDDIMRWGGPNVDNTYWRAPVSAQHTYRVTGWLPPGALFVIQSAHGEMHQNRPGICAERSNDDFAVDPDGSFTFVVSSAPHDGNWLPIDEDTDRISIREYNVEWGAAQPGRFFIERVGNEGGHPAPLNPAGFVGALDRAMTWADDALVFWNRWMDQSRGSAPPNVFYGPRSVPGGAAAIGYGGCSYQLAPDEAMIVTCDIPQARYWSFMIYSYAWFESLDFANRTVSLNNAQIATDPDGRFRLVVAHTDPGVQNWLDTEARPEALISFRWVQSTTMPTPEAQVVPFSQLGQYLPDFITRTTPAQRIDQINLRRHSRALRFRC
ncbi:DUF1214 domain-containing protein [Candidatus Poriferisocius sp.]|uniref:DUF1214 domain-containing protein n=1 Tax=Candidatus Poriferisocius sp. TaxID=3101276 RepID=UPI003B02CAE2